MTPLEQFAGDLARTQRDALTFSDPIAHADRDVSTLVADLTRRIAQASTCAAALTLHRHLHDWRTTLATLELSALVRANDLLDGKD